MKFPVTSKSINALVLSLLILTHITNNSVVNVTAIIRKSFLRSSTIQYWNRSINIISGGYNPLLTDRPISFLPSKTYYQSRDF